ncbi:MAG TPA: hypothetical protein VEF76_00680 [Patescibacteria group bacterium]|nr:hypothetical protein [Patescibacteria group bacterium]
MGLYTIANMPDLVGKMPGLTPELQKETLKQVAGIFEDIATRDHPNAALMTAFMKAAGQGFAQDLDGAKTWLDRAEALAGKTEFTKQLRQKISTVYIVVPTPAKRPPTP